MKVILLKDIPNIGERDTVLEVSAGYARNFLLPKNLAEAATPATLRALEGRKQVREKKLHVEKAKMQELASKVQGLEISIKVDVGESGKLFGSVTSSDIAQAIKEASGIEIDKRKIILEEPIKTTGAFNILVKLFTDIEATVKVNIEKREASAPA
jgi:large subunit ribosomal protein L9